MGLSLLVRTLEIINDIAQGDKSKVFHGGWVVFLGIRTIGVLLTWGGRYPDSS